MELSDYNEGDCLMLHNGDVKILVHKEFQRQILQDREEPEPDLVKPLVANTSHFNILQTPANPLLCMSCNTVFTDRLKLEEHMCPLVRFICSCGVDFHEYSAMWGHSLSHNHKPTYVTFHQRANLNRVNTIKEQESKQKLLLDMARSIGFVQNYVAFPSQSPHKSRHTTGTTIDLWWRFKPVVKLKTHLRFYGGTRYVCAICKQGLGTQDQLIEHVSSHNKTFIYGCTRCGLLLIGKAPPNLLHRCGSVFASPSKRFIFGLVQIDPLKGFINPRVYKPYLCQHCTLRFGHPVHLLNHLKVNHANISTVKEFSEKAAPVKYSQEIPPTASEGLPDCSTPDPNLRCVLCGTSQNSITNLAQHWCTRKLTLLHPKIAARMTSKQFKQKSNPCSPAQTASSGVTFRVPGIIKTCHHTKLLIKPVPIEVNVKMTQTEICHNRYVKTESDFNGSTTEKMTS